MIRSEGRRWACALVIALALLWGNRALADEPPTQPYLRLEAGMHTAPIKRISVDAQRHLLLTVSFDKTARVWSLADGRLIHVLRPPIGGGHEGEIYACALSPDGKVAAVGGWTGFEWNHAASVYLFDIGTGRLVQAADQSARSH